MTFLLVCSLQITVILLMALLAQSFLRKMSAAARHWVLSAAIVFSAIVPFLNVVMPSWSVPEAMTRHPAIVPIQERLSAITLPAPPSAESATIAAKSDPPLEHSMPSPPRKEASLPLRNSDVPESALAQFP